MKSYRGLAAKVERLLGLIACLSAGTITHGAPELQMEWPRAVFRDGVTNIVYQPQLQSWDYDTLQAVCAVAVQPRGARQPTFGTIQITAKTRVDRAARTVFLEEPEITQGHFPSAGAQAEAYLATLRALLPRDVKSISLDRLEAGLAILEARQRAASQPLQNSPPAIVFSTRPAMLVLVDGPPVYRRVENTDLERVFNTRALILRDKSGQHFLHLFDGYVQAPGLGGPWTMAPKVPADVNKAENQAVKANKWTCWRARRIPRRNRSRRSSPPLCRLFT